jgi:S1-C subfamily serine protease
MRRRTRLIITATAAAAVVIVVVAIAVFAPDSMRYRNMTGPVAIIKGDPPRHGLLGVEFASTTTWPDESASAPSSAPASGPSPLTIDSVIEGSGGAAAGLQPGDVVLALDSTPTPDFPALQRALQATSPGDQVTLTIRRASGEQHVRVRLISFTELIELSQLQRARGR